MILNRYITTFLIVLLPLVLFGQRTKELRKITERIIQYDTEINRDEIPGFIAGMIDVDSTYIVDFGSATKDSLVQLNEHTIFEMGSLTKVFTMSLLAILVDEGALSYDDKVNDLIPEVYRNKRVDPLTIKDLIMHTSGLPRLPNDFGLKEKNPNDPYAFYSKDDVLAFYSTYPFKNGIQKEYLYSHVNFALLEIILEYKCEKAYSELLNEKLIQPLGLSETFLGVNEKLFKNAAKAYSVSGEETNFWSFQSFEGSLGIKSSLHDLMILIRTYVGLENNDFSKIFSSCFEERKSIGILDKTDVSYAWYIYDHKKYYDVIMHPGKSNGHQVTIHFVPETKTAVIILANSTHNLDNLGYMMLALVNNHWRLTKKQKREIKRKNKFKT